MSLCTHPAIHLFTHNHLPGPLIYVRVHLSIYPSTYSPTHLCIYPPTHPSMHLPTGHLSLASSLITGVLVVSVTGAGFTDVRCSASRGPGCEADQWCGPYCASRALCCRSPWLLQHALPRAWGWEWASWRAREQEVLGTPAPFLLGSEGTGPRPASWFSLVLVKPSHLLKFLEFCVPQPLYLVPERMELDRKRSVPRTLPAGTWMPEVGPVTTQWVLRQSPHFARPGSQAHENPGDAHRRGAGITEGPAGTRYGCDCRPRATRSALSCLGRGLPCSPSGLPCVPSRRALPASPAQTRPLSASAFESVVCLSPLVLRHC